GLEERVLVDSNREAERLHHIIRGLPPQTFGLTDRRWIVGSNGDIYHYEFFDPQTNRFMRLSTYHVDSQAWALKPLSFPNEVQLVRVLGTGSPGFSWRAFKGWTREFTVAHRRSGATMLVNYVPFSERDVSLEPPSYFKTEHPESEHMTYAQLKSYIGQLRR